MHTPKDGTWPEIVFLKRENISFVNPYCNWSPITCRRPYSDEFREIPECGTQMGVCLSQGPESRNGRIMALR